MADARSHSGPAAQPPPSRWTGGRIASLVVGVVLGLIATGLLAAGAGALWVDQTQRQNGYLSVSTGNLSTRGYALTGGSVELEPEAPWIATSLLGDLRIEVTPTQQARAVFVGIAPTDTVDAYLRDVRHASVTSIGPGRQEYRVHPGSRVPAAPQTAGFWAARAQGPGVVTLRWPARAGRWTVVVMNADVRPGVAVSVVGKARAPALTAIAAGLLAAGTILIVVAIMMVVIPIVRASQGDHRPGREPDGTQLPPGRPPPSPGT